MRDVVVSGVMAAAVLVSACGSSKSKPPASDAGVDAPVEQTAKTDAPAGTDVAMDSPVDVPADLTGDVGADMDMATDGAADAGPPATGDSVLMHHKNPNRDGVYVQPALTRAAAAGLTRDTTFNPTFTGAVFAQPLFVDGLGGRDLIIVATESDTVYAFDAATGATAWMQSLGTPVPLRTMPCGNIDPYGITGTPVIDLPSRTLFVDAFVTPDGGATKQHQVFALSIDDGAVRPGWPVDMAAKARSGDTSFEAMPQSQRGALAIVNGTLFVPFGGLYGDCGNYHGWLVAIAIADPSQVSAWATTARAGGIWGPSGVASDGTAVYVTTGNTVGASTWGGGEAILRFAAAPALSMTPSYWAPTNWLALDNGDLDLSGTEPLVFDLPGATPAHLAVALGKDGNVYLEDADNLGGIAAPVGQLHVASNQIINAAALYTTTVGTYLTFKAAGAACTGGTSGALTTVKIVPGAPPQVMGSWCGGSGAGSPIVTTTDGRADAIVWMVGAEDNGFLQGLDGDTGAVIFDGAGVKIAGARRFNVPIAAKGRIFVAGDGTLVAFKP